MKKKIGCLLFGGSLVSLIISQFIQQGDLPTQLQSVDASERVEQEQPYLGSPPSFNYLKISPTPTTIIPPVQNLELEELINPSITRTSSVYNRDSALEYALSHVTRAVGDGFYPTMEDRIYPKFFLIGADVELPADSERYAGNDCAHFASYVLHMGGIEIPCSYNIDCRPYGILGAHSLFNYLIDNNIGNVVWEGTLQNYESDKQNIDLFLQERLEPGDLIFYAWEGAGKESVTHQHVAVYIGNNQVVSHTPNGLFDYLGTFGRNDDYHKNPVYTVVHISD